MKQLGMYLFPLDEIIGLMYHPTRALELLKSERNIILHNGIPLLDSVPAELRWQFESTGRNHAHLPQAFRFVGVPVEVIDQVITRLSLEKVVQNPLISDERKPILDILREIEMSMHNRIVNYNRGFKRIEKDNCYIWRFNADDYLVDIGVEKPITLIEKCLGPELTYECHMCGAKQSVVNDIPDMFYDPSTKDQHAYCASCASKVAMPLKHIGE